MKNIITATKKKKKKQGGRKQQILRIENTSSVKCTNNSKFAMGCHCTRKEEISFKSYKNDLALNQVNVITSELNGKLRSLD